MDAVFGLANILHKRGEEGEAMSLFKKAADKGHALSSRKIASLTGDSEMAAAATDDHTLELLDV